MLLKNQVNYSTDQGNRLHSFHKFRRLDRDLNESIDAYARGFHLKQDYYNGINLAFLLELRALTALKAGERDEGITDST
jgi:hypothetical protein